MQLVGQKVADTQTQRLLFLLRFSMQMHLSLAIVATWQPSSP